MAVSRDALGTKFLGNVSPLSSSASINVTAAATCLVVELNVDDSNVAFSGVTWGGTALTRIGTISTSDTFCKTELWGLVNPASGSQALSVSWTGGTPSNVVVCAVSYKGSQTTFAACFPSADVVTLDTTSQTNSVTVTAPSGDYAFAAGNGSNQTTYSLNQTAVYSDTTTFISGAADAAGAGTVTFTATITGPGPATIHYSLIGCHIVAAAAGAVAGLAIAAELFAPTMGPDWRPRNFQPRLAYGMPAVTTAALFASGFSAARAGAGIGPKAAMTGQLTSAATGRASPGGKTGLLAIANGQARVGAGFSGAVALAGRTLAAATTTGGIAGKVSLAAKAVAGLFARVVPPGSIALVGRAFAKMVAAVTPSGKTSLSGVLKLQSSATTGVNGATALSAIARTAAMARDGLAAAAKLAASASAASFGRSAIGVVANLGALSGLARTALSARATAVSSMAMAGRAVASMVARALISAFEPSPRAAAPDYETRVVAAPAEARAVSVPYESRVVSVSTYLIAGQAMPVNWPNKDPGEIADFDLDWTPRLGLVDTIVSSAWSIIATDAPTGTPIAIGTGPLAPSFIPTRAKVWLSGGNLGFTYAMQNTITTQNGDTLIQTAKVLIKKK